MHTQLELYPPFYSMRVALNIAYETLPWVDNSHARCHIDLAKLNEAIEGRLKVAEAKFAFTISVCTQLATANGQPPDAVKWAIDSLAPDSECSKLAPTHAEGNWRPIWHRDLAAYLANLCQLITKVSSEALNNVHVRDT